MRIDHKRLIYHKKNGIHELKIAFSGNTSECSNFWAPKNLSASNRVFGVGKNKETYNQTEDDAASGTGEQCVPIIQVVQLGHIDEEYWQACSCIHFIEVLIM